MKEGSQPKLKSPDNLAVGTHSERLCAEINLLRSMEMDSFKNFSVQMAKAADPLRGFRLSVAEMAKATDPLRGFSSQIAEAAKATDPLRGFRLSVAEMAKATDPLRGFSSQIAEAAKATDPLRGFSSQIAEMAKATDPLRGFSSQIAEAAKATDPLRGFSSQIAEMAKATDPLRGFSSQIAEAAKAIDPLKELRVQMVQIDKSVVNFARILDQIVMPTATLISTPSVGVDVFIEPEHPETVEQPGIIPCPDALVYSSSKKVFIVCGADEGAKQTVARWIEKLGLEAIIINEKPSGALTRIEKFERYTDDVDFTVALLTPDDVGKPKDKLGEPSFRASQNVILQVGVLIGKYGRDRICFLCTEELELPSDINGITPVTMDTNGGWILNLIREMESVGLPVDLQKAI